MSQFHKLTIKDIKKETDNAVSISLNVPESLKDTFRFKAGQYLTFKVTLNGEEIRRDYSICTSPNSGNLKVAVKAVDGGLFSIYANTKLNIGDTIDVAPPNGRFIFEPQNNISRTIAAFAAGSGITPVLSIINANSWHCQNCFGGRNSKQFYSHLW